MKKFYLQFVRFSESGKSALCMLDSDNNKFTLGSTMIPVYVKAEPFKDFEPKQRLEVIADEYVLIDLIIENEDGDYVVATTKEGTAKQTVMFK